MKHLLNILVFTLMSQAIMAQAFSPLFRTYSHKKVTHIQLENGDNSEVFIKDIDRKKGLIEDLKVLDANGKKIKMDPEDIVHMYVPPSAGSKLVNSYDFLGDATKWTTTNLDQDILSKGYAYIEKSDVLMKKKTKTLMLQMANAEFSKKIKVYHDPFAGESMGASIGGVNVVGGLAKSYWVKTSKDKAAWKLEKKDYKDMFSKLFGDCKAFMKANGDNTAWKDFPKMIFEYTNSCN